MTTCIMTSRIYCTQWATDKGMKEGTKEGQEEETRMGEGKKRMDGMKDGWTKV